MGHYYHHPSFEDRVLLNRLLEERFPKSRIAQLLGVARSTIYREIKRNHFTHRRSGLKRYDPMLAHRYAMARCQRPMRLLHRHDELKNVVHARLDAGWSPWQIEGRLKREGQPGLSITHETIYRYIYHNYCLRNRFFQKLRRKHFNRIKRHARRPRFPKELWIHNRPDVINHRTEFGHWECDLMHFKRGKRTNLITLRERQSRYLVAIKNDNKTAKGTALTLIRMAKQLKSYIHSLTLDQGSEFMKYQWLQSCLMTAVYVCEPGSPYQKGTIENGNGTLRAELPRATDIHAYQQQDIQRITDEINHRPLRCLGYQTPAEWFAEATAS